MKPAIKAEFRKLLSVRSTYVIFLVALILLGIGAFYGEGYKDSAGLANSPGGSVFLASTITHFSSIISVFAGITALLLFAHEYRYNTIVYSLTASNSRSKFLSAKIFVTAIYSLVFAVVLTGFALGMTLLGTKFSHNLLPHQDINYLTYMAKMVFSAEGFALAGLMLVALIRNMIGSFATLLLLPGPIENLLGLLLKQNSTYLPFMALSQVVQPPVVVAKDVGPAHGDNPLGYLSAPKGAVVFLIYLVIGWLVAWVLFLRRDAN